MYYEARSGDEPTVILSAVSADGLSWELEEGLRIGDGEWSYGTPRCLYLEDGRRRLYFHRYIHPRSPDPNGGRQISQCPVERRAGVGVRAGCPHRPGDGARNLRGVLARSRSPR